MTPLTRSLSAAMLAGWLAGIGPASAAVTPRVSDEARFFSPDAVAKANQKIREIYRDYGKDLLIETVLRVPPDMQTKYKALGKRKFFAHWAIKRAEDSGCKGIYILLCKSPGHLQIEVGRSTRQRGFTLPDRDRLVQQMSPLLVKKNQMHNDAALMLAVDTIESTLRAKLGRQEIDNKKLEDDLNALDLLEPEPDTPEPLPPANPPEPAEGDLLWTWILVGAGVVVVLWLLSAVFRAIAVGGTSGGGGFFSALLAAMFGRAAGSSLYNTFSRRRESRNVLDAAASEPASPPRMPSNRVDSGTDDGGTDVDDDGK